jgi:hypothetical protein
METDIPGRGQVTMLTLQENAKTGAWKNTPKQKTFRTDEKCGEQVLRGAE